MPLVPLEDDVASVVDLLRLHTDEQGHVWYGHDGAVGENSRCTVGVFFDKLKWLGVNLGSVRVIRLLGVPSNAELIVHLHHMRVRNKIRGQRVVLGSPMVCPTVADRGNPARVLSHLWQQYATLPSGCWHDLGDKDYTTYAMITALKDNKGEVDEQVRRIFRYHPLWPAVSFVASANCDAACRLVSHIVDPRWFRHPTRPHRLSRLHAHLGLTDKNMRAWMLQQDVGERNYARLSVLMNSWLGTNRVTDPAGPRNFLVRIHTLSGGGHKGAMIATRRYVRFLYEVWSGEVAMPRPEGGFLPSSFFKHSEEIAAYSTHLRTLDNAV